MAPDPMFGHYWNEASPGLSGSYVFWREPTPDTSGIQVVAEML